MVNQKFPRFLRLGDSAITIQFGLDTTRELNQQVSAFINSLEEEINTGYLPQIIEYVPAVSSATIYFHPECNQADLISSLKRISTKTINNHQLGLHWELPICFDPSFLNDLTDKIKNRDIINFKKPASRIKENNKWIIDTVYLPVYAVEPIK